VRKLCATGTGGKSSSQFLIILPSVAQMVPAQAVLQRHPVTYKFKLGRRNLLPRPPTSSRPRIRPKDGSSVEFEQERDLPLRRHEYTVADAATTPQDGQVMQTTATAGYQVPPAEILQSRQAERAQQQWFNLEYFLQTDTLHNVPSSGVFGPI
jgi:hypothetical protein